MKHAATFLALFSCLYVKSKDDLKIKRKEKVKLG